MHQFSVYFLLGYLFLLLSGPSFASPQILNQSFFKHERFVHKTGIIGKDERTFVSKEYGSLERGIGVLFSRNPISPWTCTAFCIDDNVIATNAHCFYQQSSSNLSYVRFGFPKMFGTSLRAYLEKETPLNFADAENARISIFSGNYRRSQSVLIHQEDWALAQLNQPICKNRTLPLDNISDRQLIKASRQNRIFMIGFHSDDLMSERKLSDNCRIYSARNRRYFPHSVRRRLRRNTPLIAHNCDGLKGSSGSPVFIRTKNGYRVIAINSGELRFARYRVRRDYYTGRIYGPRRLISKHNMNVAVHSRAFINSVRRFSTENLLKNQEQFVELQVLLKKLKLYGGGIDGKYGRGTRKAILRYEKRKKMTPLGFPTQELLLLLKEEFAPEKSINKIKEQAGNL